MTKASTQTNTPSDATAPQNGFSLISNDVLLELYSTMLKCRMLQKRLGMIVGESGRIVPFAAESHEAVAAGVVLCLQAGDTLAPAHLGFIPSFVKGLPVETIFDRILSALTHQSGGPRPAYARLKLIPPFLSLAVQLDKAVAVAAANKAAKNKQIAVAFCGSSSTSPDTLQKVMRAAGKRKLPLLLVCHSESDGEDVFEKAQECGVPGVIVDADDAVAIYRVATEAIALARRGSGPTLIDCRPWPHYGAKAGRRRSDGRAIVNMEEYLTRKGLFDKKIKSKMTAGFRRELDEAMKVN
jgi:pyruvate dehydrogenase E1 component alpha subunit